MNDRKHIDRLFQEKLKDFEATPSNAVWENISNELQAEKKDRKIIPFWIKLSGIAAALLLLFTVGNAVFNTSEENPDQETIVDTNNNSNTDSNEISTDNKQDVINLNNNNASEKEKLASEDLEANVKSESVDNDSKSSALTNKTTSDAAVANSSNNNLKKATSTIQNRTTIKNQIEVTKKDAIAQNNNGDNNNNATKSSEGNLNVVDKNAFDTVLNKNNTTKNAVAVTEVTENNTVSTVSDETKEEGDITKEEEKLSIADEIAENGLQDDNTDEKKKRKKIEDRWKISPSIAPVYFNTLGAGSSIHEQFNQNSKTGDVNMSYGVRGSYALTEKLSVRAGVNKVTLGYSTDDVFVLNNVTATPSDDRFLLRNVDLKEDAQAISFVSVEEFNFAQIPSVLSSQIIGSIDQKLGFVEVPLELEYEISSQKLGLRVLGGVSALFLNENEVYSTLDGETTLIGKATNINKTSFSANLGVGLDFKLSEKFKLNLEPTFKYQLNTFSNTSGDFKPYFIGIYSGFSFKF